MYARTQVGETFYSLQAPSGVGSKRISRRDGEIAECLACATAHAASQLVQFAEAEVVGVVDYYGVDIGYVDAAFDNGGRKQDIVVVGHEIGYGFLEFLRWHLPVCHHCAGIGNKPADHGLEVVEPFDARVDEEHLASAGYLEVQGLGHKLVGQYVDTGNNRVAVGRRSGYGGEVAGSHERELESARDGRGCHRKGVDVGFQLLELFFHGNAEFLFLVHDKQPQVLELYGFAYELVGAYYYVDFAGFEVGDDGFGVLGAACARKILHTHRKVGQAFPECVVVLASQHGCRHQHGHLLAVGGGLEGGADGDFRFAESHIAADEAVHRPFAFHVGFYGGGC